MDKLCDYCGEAIIGAKAVQKYHTECAKQALRERRQKFYYAEKKKSRPPLHCSRCGVHITNPIGNQKYCAPCAEKAKAENIIASNLRSKDRSTQKREEQKRKKLIPTLAEVDKLARAEGLSYGQYSVKHGLYASVYNTGSYI